MANHSFSTITFQWEAVHDSQIILEVEPPYGELGQCVSVSRIVMFIEKYIVIIKT